MGGCPNPAGTPQTEGTADLSGWVPRRPLHTLYVDGWVATAFSGSSMYIMRHEAVAPTGVVQSASGMCGGEPVTI